jgi:hypothetical protein
MPKIPLTNPRLKPYSLSLTTYSRKEGCGFAEWDAGCHSWIMHGKAMLSRCQEVEFALLATPLKQGKALSMREPVVAPEISPKKKNQTSCKKRKTVALATSSTNGTNGEGSNKKAHENDDTNPRSNILGKVMACDSADLRKSKPVVLAICAAPVGSDVIASSPIVIDEGPSDPMSQVRYYYFILLYIYIYIYIFWLPLDFFFFLEAEHATCCLCFSFAGSSLPLHIGREGIYPRGH